MLSVATDAQAQDELRLDLDRLVREGARRMLAAALEPRSTPTSPLTGRAGRGWPAAGGPQRPCPPARGADAAGCVAMRTPRVDDRRTDLVTGDRIRFRSVILPPWCRKSPKVAEVLPLLYLHGLSTGDFAPALAAFFGSAAGLSAAAVGRLLGAWQADYQAFCQRDLAGRDYVYLWADGLHFRVPLGAGPPVLSGAGGRARRRHQGTGRGRRRGAGVDPVVGGAAAGSASPRDARAGGRRRRRRARAVGRPARCLPSHPPPA
jgi:hypothetical protein